MKSIACCLLWALALNCLISQTPVTYTLDCEKGKIVDNNGQEVKPPARSSFLLQVSAGCCASGAPAITYQKGFASGASTPGGSGSWAADVPITTGEAKSISFTVKCGESTRTVVNLTVESPPEPSAKIDRSEPVRDAIILDSLWRNKKFEAMSVLLKSYNVETGDLDKIFYLKTYKDSLARFQAKVQELAGSQSAGGGSAAGNSQPFLGILNPTTFIDAIARLSVDRFKAELTVAYFKKFKEAIAKNKELQTLLPGVWTVLQQEDFFNFAKLLESLRQNAQSDMTDFPRNAQIYIRQHENAIDSATYPVLLSAFDLVQSVQNSQPAAAALELLATRDYIATDPKYKDWVFPRVIRASGAFSRQLHTWNDQKTTSGWVSSEDLLFLLSHEHAFNFWMALLLKTEKTELESISFDKNSLYQILNLEIVDKSGKQKARELLSQFSQVNALARQIQDLKKTNAPDSLMLRAFGQLVVGLSDFTGASVGIFRPDERRTKLDTVLRITHETGKMVQALQTKQYGVAFSSLIAVLDQCVPAKDSGWIKLLKQYGPDLVGLISANDAESLKNVLDNIVQPVQSYQLKRIPKAFSVTLNMYPGIAIGYEFDADSSNYGGFLLSPTVPVGISANWGSSCGSWSVFMPLIDVGAVAAFRFQDKVSDLPELEWSNVIAPGLYIQWGIGKSPFTLGIGGQIGPALRKVEKETNTVAARNARIALDLTVDVPLFNLYRR